MGGSPSSRRAWIEILPLLRLPPAAAVALLAEGVDRNYSDGRRDAYKEVALLAEGVDRNNLPQPPCCCTMVALLAEGVDRNLRHGLKMQGAYVALLAEGVDRNSCAWPPD